MQIINMDIDKIIPYEKNAKIHGDKQIEYIANSIKEFGFKQPIVVDKDNVVICGHGRLMAAKKLGLTSVPVKIEKDLNEEEVKALRLADNKTNESAWIYDKLTEEIESISSLDMGDFGFSLYTGKEEPSEQVLNEGGEISLGSFDDDTFIHECPNCGFKFNKGEEV